LDKSVIRNIVSLVGVQGANYIVPLITLPYLVRVLGPVGYGGLNFSLALIQYFVLFADYGFNLSVTKQISVMRDSKEKISELFWIVMFCKSVLAVFGLVTLVLLIYFFPKIGEFSIVLVCAYTVVIGNVLFPVWLFQGLERMGMIAIANITAKLMAVPLIFVFVKTSSDAWLAGLITGITTVTAGIIGLIAIRRFNWIDWHKPTWGGVKRELSLGWHVFLSTAAISLYTVSITVILGIIAGPVAVGYYTAADKIRQAVQGIIAPVSLAIYPRINALMVKDRIIAFAMIRKLLLIQGVGTFILSLLLFLFSEPIILLAYDSGYINSVTVLKWLAWLPFVIGLSNVLGIQTLLVLGLNEIFSRILIASGVLSLLLIFPLGSLWAQDGAAIATFITELTVTLLMLLIIIKREIPIFRN
jgi:Membrane protein involved in the export of O-antigen and teichoic acid